MTVSGFAFGDIEIKSGVGTVPEFSKLDNEINTGDFVSQLKEDINTRKRHLNAMEDVDFISVDIYQDKKEATFSFILKVKEQYETVYNSEASPLKLKLVIGGQGGTGTWKDTSTTPQS